MTDIRQMLPAGDPARVVLVLTTWPADRDADALAHPLVEEHLAACVNVLSVMDSVYWWQDAVQRDAERQVIIKTTAERLEALYARVRLLHPYEIPEFLVLPVCGGANAYLDWVQESTKT